MVKKLPTLIMAISCLLIANAIMIDSAVYAGVEPSPFKEIFSMQDINPIKANIKAAHQKLSQADRVKQTNLMPNIQRIKQLLESLFTKVEKTRKEFGETDDLRKLSNGISKGLSIVDGLDKKLTAENKLEFKNRLNNLSDVMRGMEQVIQSF
jgi:hypothetical protein